MKAVLFTSDRLNFSEFSVEDAQFYYELNLDLNVMKFTGDIAFESPESSREFLKNYDPYSLSGFGRWSLRTKDTDELIGWCGLKRLEDGTVDIGYRLSQKFWGKGFATEAALKSLSVGFEKYNLDEIIGRTARENSQSIKVLSKIGMQYWKDAPCEGIQDSVYYKITKEEYVKD